MAGSSALEASDGGGAADACRTGAANGRHGRAGAGLLGNHPAATGFARWIFRALVFLYQARTISRRRARCAQSDRGWSAVSLRLFRDGEPGLGGEKFSR